MSEYVPTTDEIRDDYAHMIAPHTTWGEDGFDAWLDGVRAAARREGHAVTGMEHAIEQAARVLIAHPSIPNHKDATRDVCPSCPDADVAGPNSPSHAAHQARALAEAGLLTPAPLREEALADEPAPWRCPACNSDRWIRASLTRGLTVITQCVPCGRYVNCPPPDRAEGDGSADR